MRETIPDISTPPILLWKKVLVSIVRVFVCLFNFRLSDNYVASILICLAHPHLPNSLPPRSVMYDALVVRHIVQLKLRRTEKGNPITDRVIGTYYSSTKALRADRLFDNVATSYINQWLRCTSGR